MDTLGSSPVVYDEAGNIIKDAVPPLVERKLGNSWPLVRLASFITMNIMMWCGIYLLFRRIGVFGSKNAVE